MRNSTMRNSFYPLAHFVVIFLLALYSAESSARNNVLDSIDVDESRDQSVIKISFTEQLIYRSHAPKNKADLIHISVNLQNKLRTRLLGAESLTWNPTSTVPLFQVTLDATNRSQGDLVLRFDDQVEYDIQGSPDSYSITVTIHHPQKEQPSTLPSAQVDDIVPPVPEFQKNAENEVQAQLMEEARQAMAKEDYDTAIRLYTKILSKDKSVFAKQALEYLGVAREKKNQLAHARNIYEQYLKRFPEGDDAERVRQRLLAMLSADDVPKDKLRTASKGKKEVSKWELFGGFSQFYNRNVLLSDRADRRVTLDELRSDLDVTTRYRSDDYQVTARYTGGYTSKFSGGQDDDDRLSSAYIDAKDNVRGASLRLGRQTRTTGGVLGRFDGIFGDYEFRDQYKLNLVAGYPVDSSNDVSIRTERYFYGVSLDIGTINKAWDYNIFAIDQTFDNVTDRRAIGGEIRYFDPVKSFFTLVDYDTHHDQLNTFLMNGRWNISDKTSFNSNYEYRTTPILTTRNALIGQNGLGLQELLNTFSKSTLFDLAKDRTGDSNILFAGITHQLNNKFQLDGDIRLSKLSGTKSSAGVLGIDDSDLEKEYSLQVTGTSLLKEGDLALVTTTYSDLTFSDVTTITINTRYPITRKLRINPKLQVRYRDNHSSDTTQRIYSPSLQITYRIRRNLQLEAEVVGDWEKSEPSGQDSERTRNFFFLVGYRYDF